MGLFYRRGGFSEKGKVGLTGGCNFKYAGKRQGQVEKIVVSRKNCSVFLTSELFLP